MSANTALSVLIFFLGLGLLGPRAGFGGGFFIPHQSARGVALGSALTAGINDPSAVYYNPAALSEVDGNRLLLTGNYINVVNSVENGGRKAENLREDNFTASVFGNYHVPGTDLTLGLGMYTPFGLMTSYHKGFTRFAARDTELKTLYVVPVVAWNPSRFFSVGGGVGFIHSSALFSSSLCFDPLFGCAFPGGEERIRITDTANTYSYTVGVLAKPVDRIKIGFSYRAGADLHFDNAETGLRGDFGPAKTKANIRPVPLPAVIDVGLFWQINPSWGAELVYEYQRWSDFKRLKAKFSPPPFGIANFALSQNWRNTSTMRLGSFYRLTKNWEVQAGFVLEEGPVPNKTLNPAIPGADLLALSTGVEYRWESLSVDVGYQASFYKTRKVSNSALEGRWTPGCGFPAGCPFSGAPGKDKYQIFNNFVSISLGYRF